jgi:hypothetical protein
MRNPPQCRNCGAVIAGHFCANCGQAADVHVPSTQELIHDALEGVTHSDSRLWRTLKLLWFKPGSLTLEFIAGRRAAFLPPFRLYLVLSVLFFLMASFSHLKGNVVHLGSELQNTPEEACRSSSMVVFNSPRWDERLRHGCEAVLHDRGENLLHVVIGTMPKAMFIFLPLIAFFHMLLYWRPRHRYAEHLLFFIHLHAFFFSVMTLVVVAFDIGETWPRTNMLTSAVNTVLLWCLPLYTVIAMRRVFRRRWTSMVFKVLALFLVYLVVLTITVGAVFLYAVLRL